MAGFFFSTVHFGTFIARFWPNPGATSLGVGLYMQADSSVVARSSAGQTVRAYGYNGGGPVVQFPSAGPGNYVDVFSFSGGNNVTALTGYFSGIGPVLGVLDFTLFPPSYFVNIQFSTGYTKVKAPVGTGILLIGFRYSNALLDLSECHAGVIDAGSSYCTNLLLPPAGQIQLRSLNLTENRLYNRSLAFPYPHLSYVGLGAGQSGVTRLNTLDLSEAPALQIVNVYATSVRTLVIGTNAFAHLTTLQASGCRLTARDVDWGRGSFSALIQLLDRATQLTSISLGLCGFTEAEVVAVVATLLGTATNRAPANLVLADETNSNAYPGPYASNADFGYACNAPAVTLATRQHLADLVAAGWTVSYNRRLRLAVQRVDAHTVQATWPGLADVDLWQVGDALDLVSETPTQLPSGTYTVVESAPRQWRLSSATANTLAPDATAWAAVDAG